jgi:hypothetical protein
MSDLSPQAEQYLSKLVEGGFYPSTEAAIDAAVDALREKHAEIPLVPDEHMDAVEHAIVAGNSGQSTPMTQDDWTKLRFRAHEVSANKSSHPH